MPGSVSRTARISTLALVLVAAGGGLPVAAHVEPAERHFQGVEDAVPETFEAAVADGEAGRGGISGADDWLG